MPSVDAIVENVLTFEYVIHCGKIFKHSVTLQFSKKWTLYQPSLIFGKVALAAMKQVSYTLALFCSKQSISSWLIKFRQVAELAASGCGNFHVMSEKSNLLTCPTARLKFSI